LSKMECLASGCLIPGCNAPAQVFDTCRSHKNTCSYPGCSRPSPQWQDCFFHFDYPDFENPLLYQCVLGRRRCYFWDNREKDLLEWFTNNRELQGQTVTAKQLAEMLPSSCRYTGEDQRVVVQDLMPALLCDHNALWFAARGLERFLRHDFLLVHRTSWTHGYAAQHLLVDDFDKLAIAGPRFFPSQFSDWISDWRREMEAWQHNKKMVEYEAAMMLWVFKEKGADAAIQSRNQLALCLGGCLY